MAAGGAPAAVLAAAGGAAAFAAAAAVSLGAVDSRGAAPDRVTAAGSAIFAPGPPGAWPISLAWDNGPFAALLLDAAVGAQADARSRDALFCAWEPTIRRALDFVPLVRGLAWNDPASPNVSFGFQDSVVLPGRQLTVSLLLADAAARMASRALAAGCGSIAHYQELAAAVAAAIDDLFDAPSGLFLASDTLETVPDVFGSAYVAALGLSTPARRVGIGGWLAAQWRASNNATAPPTVWQEGQVRHLPQPLLWARCWAGCPSPGTYQNGAYWATPLDWVLPAMVAAGFEADASEAAGAAIASFRERGVMEAIDRPLGYAGVRDYVASATNLLRVVAPAATS